MDDRSLLPAGVTRPDRAAVLGHASSSSSDVAAAGRLLRAALAFPSKPAQFSDEWRDLGRRLLIVLRAARNHVPRLDEYASYWGDEGDPFVTLADKIVVEASLLAMLAARTASTVDSPSIARATRDLGETLSPAARSTRNQALLLRFPQTAMSLGIAHVALTQSGCPDPHFAELLDAALRSGRADASERLPYRAMERRWLEGLCGAADVRFDDLVEQSIVTKGPHPIDMLATDVYALTHVPMFVTDFGRASAAIPLPIEAAIDAVIEWTLFTDNFDLLAELVLAATLVRSWTPAVEAAWEVLRAVWDDLGFLPSPSLEVAKFAQLDPASRPAAAFRHVYHTTFVGGMLCASLLMSEPNMRQSPAKVAADDPELATCARAAVEAATRYTKVQRGVAYDIDRKTAPTVYTETEALAAAVELATAFAERSVVGDAWRHIPTLSSIGPCERAGILIDGVMTAAARAYDLVAVARGLAVSAALPCPLSVTVFEAARFLIRQQVPEGAIGAWAVAVNSQTAAAGAAEVTSSLSDGLAAIIPRLAAKTA